LQCSASTSAGSFETTADRKGVDNSQLHHRSDGQSDEAPSTQLGVLHFFGLPHTDSPQHFSDMLYLYTTRSKGTVAGAQGGCGSKSLPRLSPSYPLIESQDGPASRVSYSGVEKMSGGRLWLMTPRASSLLGFSALMMPLSCENSSSTLPGCAIPATLNASVLLQVSCMLNPQKALRGLSQGTLLGFGDILGAILWVFIAKS